MPSTGKLKASKLMKLAGAIGRRFEEPRCCRAYLRHGLGEEGGVGCHLHQLEEAVEARPPQAGQALELFSYAGFVPRMVFLASQRLDAVAGSRQYMRRTFREHDYQEVRTPTIMDRTLWRKSGHWENYTTTFVTTASEKSRTTRSADELSRAWADIQSWTAQLSRLATEAWAEFGSCHRNETSVHDTALMRVRGFTQDDAHIS